MTLTVIKHTVGGVLFKSDDAVAITWPVAILHGKKPVGRVLETIGPVSSPRYVGVLDKSFPIGSEFEIAKKNDSRRR